MIELAVFDWNGTLLADTNAIVESTNEELVVFEHPSITVKEYREHYDVPTSHFFQNLGVVPAVFTAKSAEAAQVFHAAYEPRVARAHTRRGARAALETLALRGVQRIILSNHTMEGIYFQLERLKLGDHFEAVLANETIGKNHFTGKEERLREYLKTKNMLASQAVIIGDTVEEVRIGRNLGMKTIAITGGYNSLSRLKQAKPDAIINTLHQLDAAMESL